MIIKELVEYNALKEAGVGVGEPDTFEMKNERDKAWMKAIAKAEKEAKIRIEASKRKSRKSKAE